MLLSSGSLMTAAKHLRALDSLHSTIFNLFSFSTESRRFSATFFLMSMGVFWGVFWCAPLKSPVADISTMHLFEMLLHLKIS